MKKPDEIKKGLSCCELECADRTARCRNECPYYPECDFGQAVVEDSLALIQQLEADNAQQARCIENLTDKMNATNDALPRWISVEEGLPELGVYVAVHYGKFHGNLAGVMMWDGDHWIMCDGFQEQDGVITHWMPLPEPPKEEK